MVVVAVGAPGGGAIYFFPTSYVFTSLVTVFRSPAMRLPEPVI